MKFLQRSLALLLALVLCGTLTVPALGAESAAESDAAAVTDITGTVTGFDPLEDDVIALTERVPLDELLTYMPETLSVYLDGGTEAVSIPVTWYCLDDYETSPYYYFQFSPQWDTDLYPLLDGLDVELDAPYITVIFDEPMAVSSEEVYNSSSTSAATVKQQVYTYLTDTMGLSCAAACGVLANAYHESSYKPTAQGTAADGSVSYGLFQWSYGRYTNLKSYCKSNGYDYTTVDGQMHFLEYELTNSYKSVLTYLRSCTNSAQGAYDAGYYFCYHFEIPSDTAKRSVTRGNYAKNTLWPEFVGTTSSTPVLSGASTPASSITKGTAVSVYGTVSCAATLTSVTVGVYNSAGTMVTGKTVAPKSTTYNLSALDDDVKFSALAVGSYTYKITASTSSGSYSLLECSFQVTAAVQTNSTSTTGSSSTATSKPGKVTGLTTSNATTDQLTISWNAVSGATGYEVYYCRIYDGTYKKLKTVTTTSYTTGTGKTAGQGYYYKVRAVNTAGKGSFSSRLSTQTKMATSTTATTTGQLHLRAHAGTSYDSKLVMPKGAKLTVVCKTWDKSGGVWYKVQYTKSGTTYTGYCSGNWLKLSTGSSSSTTTSTATATSKPGKVTGLTTAKATTDQLTISWDSVSGATGYEVYYCRIYDGTYTKLKTVTTTSYTTGTGKTAGRGYYYKVRAVNAAGKGSFSSRLSTQTKMATSTTATTTGQLHLRAHAGTSYDSKLVMPKGAKLTVICKTWDKSGSVWYKVQYTKSGTTYTGYCSGNWLKLSTGSSSSTSSSSSSTKTVTTTANVNLRKSASTSSAVLAVVPKGTKLKTTGKSGGWYKVSYTKSGTTYTGYIYGTYLK